MRPSWNDRKMEKVLPERKGNETGELSRSSRDEIEI
jgi:hypothetical protein